METTYAVVLEALAIGTYAVATVTAGLMVLAGARKAAGLLRSAPG